MRGIVAYGAYVPYHRLRRAAIAAALGAPPGKGSRAVASYDEDATSMGVEAARIALRSAPGGFDRPGVLFATTNPPYADKTNATAIHAALDLPASTHAFDLVGSVRSAAAALAAAYFMPGPQLAVLGDIRTGMPGGADERDGGDGAAAFLYGDGDESTVLVEGLGGANATAEFLDRWRVPGEPSSRLWEERFGEQRYVPLAEQAVTDVLKFTGLSPGELDHVVITGVHPRAARRVAKQLGARPESFADDLTGEIGYTGAAHAGIVLADVLDRAEPGQTILVVQLADGADAMVFRTTDAVAARRTDEDRRSTVRAQIDAGRDDLAYATFLTWRGMLVREPPRRPDPTPPAAPPSSRNESWKFGFTASRCTTCGTRHLPPARVCVECGATDQMTAERLADVPATIATYTVDRLAYSLNPPMVAAVIDFDGGGRLNCELTDVDSDTVAIGDRVEMTFRRLFTANGVHNYAWKARPVRGDN